MVDWDEEEIAALMRDSGFEQDILTLEGSPWKLAAGPEVFSRDEFKTRLPKPICIIWGACSGNL
jgi:hypothetical protein